MPEEARITYGDVECKLLYDKGDRGLVVFLHGYSFRGATWYEAGIAGKVASEGYSTAAPDMPYGRSTSCSKKTRQLEVNLAIIEGVVESLAPSSPPVLVGASLGGRVALYYALTRRVAGLYLAAPYLREDDPLWGELRGLQGTPLLVVWGTRDRVVSRAVAERLASGVGGELVVYEGAGHAPYLDRPGEFVRGLLSFLDMVMGSR